MQTWTVYAVTAIHMSFQNFSMKFILVFLTLFPVLVFSQHESKLGSNIAVREDVINIKNHGITGALSDSSRWIKVLNLSKTTGKTIFVPKGIYQFKEDFNFDFDSLSLVINGEVGAIFTTSESRSLKQPIRINLNNPSPGNGFYKVDVLPPVSKIDPDWSTISGTVSLDDYIKVDGVSTTIVPIDSLASNGYLIDISNVTGDPEPTASGYYVVNKIDFNYGGGYAYDLFIHDASLRVTLGSILFRSPGGVWSIYVPSNGFEGDGDIHFSNITFDNFAPFCISPHGTRENKKFNLSNCRFYDVTRVLSLESSGGDAGALDPSYAHKPGPGFQPFTKYSFSEFHIDQCHFERFHQSIAWGVTPTKEFKITNNTIRNTYSSIVAFHYLWDDLPDNLTCVISNNIVEDFRNYSESFAVDRIIFRTPKQAVYSENKFYRSNGIHIYNSGKSNHVVNNEVYPYTEYFSGNNSVGVHCKVNYQDGPGDYVSNNIIIGGGKFYPINITKNLPIDIINNEVKNGSGVRYIFHDTESVNKALSYLVRDTTNYKTLAVDYDTSSVGIGNKVYYNYRESRWKEVPAGVGTIPAIIWFPSSDLEYDINITGGSYDAEMLFQSNTTSFTAQKIFIDKVHSIGNLGFLQIDDVKYCELKNSTIEINGAASGFMKPDSSWSINSCSFLKSPLGKMELYSNDDLSVTNCTFGTIYKDRYTELGRTTAVYVEAIYINVSGTLTLKGCEVSAATARNGAIRIEQADKAVIVDNYFDLRIDTTTSSDRVLLFVVDPFSGTDISFEKNTVNFDNSATRRFFFTSLSSATTLTNLNIKETTYTGNQPTQFINSFSSNLTITNLGIGTEINDVITTFNTNATITNIKDVRIPGGANLHTTGDIILDNIFKMTPSATVPGSPGTGWIYFDDGTNHGSTNPGLRYYNGTVWMDL